MKRLTITALDHIVLNVRDIERALTFYIDVLGLKPERLDQFNAGEVGFPSVRINSATIIDLFPRQDAGAGEKAAAIREPNLNHFCMVIGHEDFADIVEYLKEKRVEVHHGPVSRWGARGTATSVYFHDPDGNEIELRCY
jgi:glyoxylase I family protein